LPIVRPVRLITIEPSAAAASPARIELAAGTHVAVLYTIIPALVGHHDNPEIGLTNSHSTYMEDVVATNLYHTVVLNAVAAPLDAAAVTSPA
jgi:hypothetical protein